MTTKKTVLILSTIVAILMVPTAFGNNGVPSSITELNAEFVGFEDFLTDVSNEINTNMVSISDIQGNQTDILSDIMILNINATDFDDRISLIESAGYVSYTKTQQIDARFTDGENFMVDSSSGSYMSSYMDGTAIVKVNGDQVVQSGRTYDIKIYHEGTVVKTCTITSLQPIECETSFSISQFDKVQVSYKRTAGTTDTSYKVNLDAYMKMIES